ncbi:MAG: glycoside hydrolase family 88 protein [Lachnospiraceae bacterium]|nr:glycoside hydrolase family 88 protein [Lachnospiraceae bacterium]
MSEEWFRKENVKVEYDRDEILDAMKRVADRTMGLDMPWDWPCGVAYYGISKAYEITKDDWFLKGMKARVDEYIELGLPKVWTVNTCAMGHSLLTLYRATGDERYREILMSKVDYIRYEALRFGDHVLQHTVSANNDFPEQCWADTLFMAAYLLLRVGVELQDEEMIDDALNQYYWHIQYLQDKENGLWFHGYNNITGDHMSGIHWGRANAWAAYTMSQAKHVLPKAYLYPKYMDIAGSLSEQLSALKHLQTENGLWRTVVDDPESYEEISASAGIAAAMAAAGNPLHRKCINKAIKGILSNISPDGRVLNVSGGTAVMDDIDGYRGISRDWIQGWGQGLALAFLSLLLDMGNSSADGAL